MRRFLDQKPDVVLQESVELTMEDVAKMRIREKLLETAVVFGVFLNLTENSAAQEKKPEKPPVFSAPEHEQFYHALSVLETGSEKTLGFAQEAKTQLHMVQFR